MAKDPKIGQTISNYRIIRHLGGGGMGVVYQAEDTRLRRTVALKFLPQQLTSDEQFTARFINEAQAASALDHPRIATIYGFEESPEGELFIAMAYYEGETLKKMISRGPVPLDDTTNLIIQVCNGLQEAHSQGIVHRDVKPANVIVTTEGFVKIVDFGLAKLGESNRLTRTGTIMGTPAYMSPEQIRGLPTDQRTDIWSVGVMLYEMLTGQLPFNGENDMAVLYAAANEQPVNVLELQPDLPSSIEGVVLKAIAKRPEDRFASADELSSSLRKINQVTATHGVHAKTVLIGEKTVLAEDANSARDKSVAKVDRPIPKRHKVEVETRKSRWELLHRWYPALVVAVVVLIGLLYRSSTSDLPSQPVKNQGVVSQNDSLASVATDPATEGNQVKASTVTTGDPKEDLADRAGSSVKSSQKNQKEVQTDDEGVTLASKEMSRMESREPVQTDMRRGAEAEQPVAGEGQHTAPSATEHLIPVKNRGIGFLSVTALQVRGDRTGPVPANIEVGEWRGPSPVFKHPLREGTYTVKASVFPETIEEEVQIVADSTKKITFTFGKY
jgi:serine/threonine protein kinase